MQNTIFLIFSVDAYYIIDNKEKNIFITYLVFNYVKNMGEIVDSKQSPWYQSVCPFTEML
jgi:hypothetical protein